MPHSLGRNLDLNLCFTKIKFPLHFSQSSASPPQTTPDHHHHHSRPISSAPPNMITTPNNNMMIIRNFNSLYDSSSTSTSSLAAAADDDDDDAAAAADFASAFASRRFFFSTPGRSNSIIDSPSAAGARLRDVGGGAAVAVPRLSPDPYADFRRSMQEMVEARELTAAKRTSWSSSDWEFLHELLLCYLALNAKSTHKFIIGAFSDLVVSLLPPIPAESSVRREADLAAATVVSDR